MRSSHTSSCETPNTFQLGSEFRCSSYDGGAPCFLVNEDIEQLMLHLSLGESSISQDMKVIGQVEMIEGVFSKISVEGEENLHGSLDGHLSTPTARSTCTCEDSALPSHQSSALKCIELDRNDMANSTREQNTTGMIPARRPQMIDCQIAQTYALTTVDSCILNSNSTTSTWTHVDVREWVEISCRTNLQLRFLEFEHNLRRAKESATQEDMNDGKSSYRQSLESMEKDLARTFPQHPDFIPGEQMYEAMRDVLMAYSHRTLPDGYCQGMNYIVGLLLMALEPSQSRCVYAILTEICEQSKYNEAYYTSEMIGLQADCALIDQYIGEAFPSLGQHMSDKGITLGFFFARWFITICTDVLPFPHAVCFMDAYIREGSIVLYFFILGIIENNHSALHAIEDGSDIAQLVTHLLSDPNFHVNVYIQRGRGIGLITSDSEHNSRRRQMKENMRTRQLIPSHLTASCDMKDTDTQFYEPDQSTDQKNSPCTKPIVSKKIPSRKNWMWNIWPFKHTMP